MPDPAEESHIEPNAPKGWHSRGYLPHFDGENLVQHVTIHLADSLPRDAVERIAAELAEIDPDRREIERRLRLEALVDAGHGACWLKRHECARVVQDSLLHFDSVRYRTIAWVIMPNHVHALIQPVSGWSLDDIVASWKTFTANGIGRLVRGANEPTPRVWQAEFWDRFVRDENHFANVMAYIHNNPVKAGLVARAEDWRWSSAHPENIRGG
jgi:REP element-mobilizing transposase RayT